MATSPGGAEEGLDELDCELVLELESLEAPDPDFESLEVLLLELVVTSHNYYYYHSLIFAYFH